MDTKKGIELSVNFIVVLIISIVLFGLGVKFIRDIALQATDITKMTIEEVDRRIDNLICEGTARVCLGTDSKIINRGKTGFFGVKIMNVLSSQNFDIIVSRPMPLGIAKNQKEIFKDDFVWIPKDGRSVFIKQNEEKLIGIAIQVPSNAVSGTYIFDVNIQTQDAKPYSQVQKFYVNVP